MCGTKFHVYNPPYLIYRLLLEFLKTYTVEKLDFFVQIYIATATFTLFHIYSNKNSSSLKSCGIGKCSVFGKKNQPQLTNVVLLSD